MKRNLPNCITLLNLLSGLMAIICAFKGTEPWWGLKGWQWGAIFIGIGTVTDYLDGFFARFLKAYSELGKELDSLSDLVSFGVAPAMLVYNIMGGEGIVGWLRWCVLLVPLVAALRLARYNIDTRQTTFFIGMPVPSNAIFWIGFCGLVTSGATFLTLPAVYIPTVIIEAWLMVSPFKIMSLKLRDYRFSGLNRWRYFLAFTAFALLFTMGVGGLMWLILVYLLISLCVKVDA